MNREGSAASILSSGDFCRICHCDSSCGELISPCYCAGSLKWVHQICLQHWIRASNSKACELCRYPFIMKTKLKPFYSWEILPMTGSEKRRSICSAFFHIIALSCVTWSLYVLIDRTVEEFQQPELEWQFWTKIVVETIGCIGAFILVWVWGKSYISLIRKWIAFNRTFVITNSTPAPVKQKPSSCVATICPTTKSTSTCSTSTPPLYHNCPTEVIVVMNSPTPTNANVTEREPAAPLVATETVAIVDSTNSDDEKVAHEDGDNLNMDNDCEEAKPLLLSSSKITIEPSSVGAGDISSSKSEENT